MNEATLLDELIRVSAARTPAAPALVSGSPYLDYAALTRGTDAFAAGVRPLHIERGARIGIDLDKREETVIAAFGAAAAGAVFVPIKPVLKPEQVAYILRDCN